MARCHGFDILVRVLGMKVIPCKEPIESVEIITLRNEMFKPNLFDFLEGKEREKCINLWKIQIDHSLLYQDVIRYIIDRLLIERPKAMFVLEFGY